MSDLNFKCGHYQLLRNQVDSTWLNHSLTCNKVIFFPQLQEWAGCETDLGKHVMCFCQNLTTHVQNQGFWQKLICGYHNFKLATLPVMKRFCQMIPLDYNPYRSIISEAVWSINNLNIHIYSWSWHPKLFLISLRCCVFWMMTKSPWTRTCQMFLNIIPINITTVSILCLIGLFLSTWQPVH